MAFNNFKPTVWAANIATELEKALVFAEDTNREYEGLVKKSGDTVRILGVGRPTVTTYTGNDKITLSGAETVQDSSITMPIDKTSTFNFAVGDIDAAQSNGNLLETLTKEAAYQIADEIDQGIADVAKDVAAQKAWTSAKTDVASTNILGYVDECLQKLYENNVKPNAGITITAPPWFCLLMKQALVNADTDNTKLLEHGFMGMYNNAKLKMSNNVATDSSSNSLIQIKTDKAIAYCNPMTHTESYRPDSTFEDCMKGFSLWKAKLVRPEEMVVMNCKAAS